MYVGLLPTPLPPFALTLCLSSHHRVCSPQRGCSWHNKNGWKHHLELCLFISTCTCTHNKNTAHPASFLRDILVTAGLQADRERIPNRIFLLCIHQTSISLLKHNKELNRPLLSKSCYPPTACSGPLWHWHYLWKKVQIPVGWRSLHNTAWELARLLAASPRS